MKGEVKVLNMVSLKKYKKDFKGCSPVRDKDGYFVILIEQDQNLINRRKI